MHKTGTTSIQNSLKDLSDGVTKYASFNDCNHSIAMRSIFDSVDALCKRKIILYAKDKAHVIKIKKRNTKIFKDDLNDKNFERLIISGEGIGLFESDQKKALINEIKAAGCDVKIVCCVRSPVDYIVSAAQQKLKKNVLVTGFDSIYKCRLAEFLNLIPRKNILVYDYQKAVESGCIVNYFSSLIDVKLEAVQRHNESLSAQGCAVLRAFNQFRIANEQSNEISKYFQSIYQTTRDIFSFENGCDRLDPVYFYDFMPSDIMDDCDWLKQEFSIDYTYDIDSSSKMDLYAYLDSCLDGHEDKVEALFNEFDIPYYSALNMVENFQIGFDIKYRNISVCDERDTNNIRDIALKISHKHELGIDDALALMRIAGKLRPNGSLIQKKIHEWGELSDGEIN